MSAFFERWQFKHPRPEDFLAVFDQPAFAALAAQAKAKLGA